MTLTKVQSHRHRKDRQDPSQPHQAARKQQEELGVSLSRRQQQRRVNHAVSYHVEIYYILLSNVYTTCYCIYYKILI